MWKHRFNPYGKLSRQQVLGDRQDAGRCSKACVCVCAAAPPLPVYVSHLVDISLSDNEDQLAVFLHHGPILQHTLHFQCDFLTPSRGQDILRTGL